MFNIPIRKIPTTSKIPIQMKNNSTTEIIIMIKEKNTLAIVDMITILQRKIILLTSKTSQQDFN